MSPRLARCSSFIGALTLGVLTLHGPALGAAAGRVHGERGGAIDRHVSRLAAFGISGALYVEHEGVVLVERGYGLADLESGARIEADSPFLIGSLSKQMTAAAILALEADGKLSSADSVGRFYPDAPPATRGLTLHQLLSHTSGLPYMTRRPFFESRPRDSVMREMLALPLDFEPGAKWSYSNPGYTLLAGIVERASGTTFEHYMKTRIFERAGLRRTRLLEPGLRDTADLLVVHSYSSGNDEGTMLPLRAMSKSVGAGSVVSTAADLGRWSRALETDAVLPAAQRAKLFAPHAEVNPTTSYGYGWNVAKTSRGTTMFAHAGDLGGWNVEMRIDREAKLVLVFLSNQRVDGKGSRNAVLNPVTLLATGAKVPELPAVRTPKSDELTALAGRYAFADQGTLVARALVGALEVSAEDAGGLARLAGEGASPPESLGLAAKALAVVDGWGRKSFDALTASLHPSLPSNEALAAIGAEAADADQRLGVWIRTEPIGTVSTGPNTAVSFVRLHRERGAALVRLGWVNGKILSFEFDAPAVLPTRFLPAEGGAWVNVDPFTARVTTLQPDRDARGKVSALGLGGAPGAAEARARRQG